MIYCLVNALDDIKIFFILTIAGVVMAVLSWNCLGGERVTIPEYKVTIDDSVSYQEFANKYKVIKQEGKIYTIVDIEELAAAKGE